MEMKQNQREQMLSQLKKAIDAGDTETAETLVDALYPEDAPREISMPTDFPLRVAAAAEKGRATMKKASLIRKFAASAAAVAIVFSLGITAYAQGWFVNPVSVIEDENIVATGENISTEEAGKLLAEQDSMEEVYRQTEYISYPDVEKACAAIGLPYIYPAYLEEHPEFKGEDGAVAVTNPILPDKQVYDDFFAPGAKGISLSISYQENTEDIFAAYCDTLKVENPREFTTESGDTYTLFDTRYTDSENEKLVQAVIGINHYVFDIAFSNISEDEMIAALNSVDLTPLK